MAERSDRCGFWCAKDPDTGELLCKRRMRWVEECPLMHDADGGVIEDDNEETEEDNE